MSLEKEKSMADVVTDVVASASASALASASASASVSASASASASASPPSSLAGIQLTSDEVVAIAVACACVLSVVLTLLSPLLIWLLKVTCLWDCLVRMETQTKLQAEQAALVRDLKAKKVSKYADANGQIAINIVSNSTLLPSKPSAPSKAASPSKTPPAKASPCSGLSAIAAKAQKGKAAAMSPAAKVAASSPAKEKVLTVAERRAMRAAALHGEAAGKVSGYGSELLMAEVNAEASKLDDQRKALAVTGKPTENTDGLNKRPRAGVRG